jgi:light-regulated signal transduction histidine kinase (bacteriophytochrome)
MTDLLPPSARVMQGVLILDVDGTVIFASDEAARLLGQSPEKLRGRQAADLWVTADGPAGMGPPIMMGRNGRPLQTIITPLNSNSLYPDSPPLTLILVQRPPESDETLQQLQKLANLGRLAHTVVHEINAPLSVITDACNNLLRQIADDKLDSDQLLHYIGLIDQSAWRSMKLAQTLRGYNNRERAAN